MNKERRELKIKQILAGILSAIFIVGLIVPIDIFAIEKNVNKKFEAKFTKINTENKTNKKSKSVKVYKNKLSKQEQNEAKLKIEQKVNQFGSINKKATSFHFTNPYFVITPKNHTVFYRGEKCKFYTGGVNPFANGVYNSLWGVDVYDTYSASIGDYKYYTEMFTEYLGSDEYNWGYDCWFETKKIVGNRFLVLSGIVGYWNPDDDEPDEIDALNEYYLRTLKKPTKLKAKAKKKRVTISFKKATGGTKYEIYRSRKKKSGYKKIRTTKNRTYIDKKVKKGKRYYYKVRTYRNVGRGTVRSAFAKPVRSGKVK